MNKRLRIAIATAALGATALLSGGLFAAGSVGAQVDNAPDTTVEQPLDTPSDVPVDEPADERGAHHRRGHHRGERGERVEATAELLGIDVDELRTALRDGDTLAEIAEANGVDPQTLIDAQVAEQTERIDAAVDAGRLTQAEADERLAELTERVTARVNDGRPERGDCGDEAEGIGTDAADGLVGEA